MGEWVGGWVGGDDLLGLLHEGSNAEVALGALHFVGQSTSSQ